MPSLWRSYCIMVAAKILLLSAIATLFAAVALSLRLNFLNNPITIYYSMKKFFIAVLSVALFAACNGGTDPKAVDAQKADEAAKAQAAAQAAAAAAAQAAAAPQVSPEEQMATDKGLIDQYVAQKGLKCKNTSSGIYYVIEKEGKGTSPTENSTVKVHYSGTLLDGTEFDSSYSRNKPAEFPLNGVIKGWQEAIPLLKPGGKGKFIIPSSLAYGPRAMGAKIPANSVLVFDVELLEVK